MSLKYISLNDGLYNYLRPLHSQAGDPLLAELRRETEALGDISRMQISEEQGTFLRLLVAITGAKSAVEVGTFTGYSSLCLARGLPPGGKLLCCDVSREWTAVAERYWTRAGVRDRIELRLGPAQETLAALAPDRAFDFAFIDADKPGYDAYYELILPRLRPNGLVVFDNMLSDGRVLHPDNDNVRAIDRMNRKLAADPRVESVLIPVADGLNLCRKK